VLVLRRVGLETVRPAVEWDALIERKGGYRSVCRARPLRGANVLIDPDDYVCIDIETTGLSPARESIIEIAAYRMREGAMDDAFVSFVRPDKHVSSFITSLTGITDADVEDAPLPSEVLPDLKDFVGGDPILGHNVSFDMNFIHDACLREGIEPIGNDFFDTKNIAKWGLPGLENGRLETVAEYLSIPLGVHHRAGADVETTVRCYEAMVKGREPIFRRK